MKLFLTLCIGIFTVICNAQEQYQDIVINNQIVSEGSRECSVRYEALKPLLNKFKRSFTVLDIGASQGFFSFKIAAEYPNAVAVMIEGNYDTTWNVAQQLLDLCQKNTLLHNIIFLQKHITIEDLIQLGKTEHFDVVLAFNIIHHFKESWRKAADAIFTLGDHIIIETPPSNDKVFANNKQIKELEKYLTQKNGTIIAQTPRHTDPTALAPMIHFELQKKFISHKHWFFGTPADGISIVYEILSDFKQKIFKKTKPEAIITRSWSPGVNFVTFKTLNGVWPELITVAQEILNFKHEDHGDLMPWNIIISGNQLVTIDNDGEFYADPARALLYTLQFGLLTEYKDIQNYLLHEEHPAYWKQILKSVYKNNSVTAPVSYGELIDKITILELKKKFAQDAEKLKNITYELQILEETLQSTAISTPELTQLTLQLAAVNQDLWDIEDKIRIKENLKSFDQEFIDLARSVYIKNDRRCALKREINELLGSQIIEEKLYAQYSVN